MRVRTISTVSILFASLAGLTALPVPATIVDWLITPVAAHHDPNGEFCQITNPDHPHCDNNDGGGVTGSGLNVVILPGTECGPSGGRDCVTPAACDPATGVGCNWVGEVPAPMDCIGKTSQDKSLDGNFRKRWTNPEQDDSVRDGCPWVMVKDQNGADLNLYLFALSGNNKKNTWCTTLWFHRDGIRGNENVYHTDCLVGAIDPLAVIPDFLSDNDVSLSQSFAIPDTSNGNTLGLDLCLIKGSQPDKGTVVGQPNAEGECPEYGIDVHSIFYWKCSPDEDHPTLCQASGIEP